MKNRNKIPFWLSLSFILSLNSINNVQAQLLPNPENSGENIHLYSDRSVYTVSEKLFYTAFYQKPPQITTMEWSTVLYVELIKWYGTKLAQSKVPIENGSANGFIQIPTNIRSGNYYLRAYTKWMRNYSPYKYSYLQVKIVNPYTTAIDKGPEVHEASAIKRLENSSELTEEIVVTKLSKSYEKRQLVDFEIAIPDNNLSGQYCLSITKLNDTNILDHSFSFEDGDIPEESNEFKFLPEINGLSLSGRLINKDNQEPVKNMKVNLSSYSSSFFYSAVSSDENGTFLFTLPHYKGKHEFHIAKKINSDENIEILVNTEFCHKSIKLPYITFQLSEQEKIFVKEMMLNAQLNSRYIDVDSTLSHKQDISTSFYGKPTGITYVKEYIELINLQEFFYELIYNVSINYLDKKPYLSIKGRTSLISYPPLLLMDNVPVANDELLLNISSRKIERIEVINKGYIVGDFKYKGLISIFSDKKDMAGLESEENSHFFNYMLFDENNYSFHDYSITPTSSTVSDRRNLLFWQPHLQLSKDKHAKVSFYTSDAPGKYVVCLRGVDKESKLKVYKKATFLVK